MRALILTLMLLLSTVPAAAQTKPIPIKVVVLTAFEVGADSGDRPGEFQAWVERYPLTETMKVPGIERPVRLSGDGVLGVVMGEFGRARGSVMALALDPRFDVSKAYWIMAGIAGVDPQAAPIGSAAWADWVVDGDPVYEIDDREKPTDWPWGLYAFGAKKPGEKGRVDDFSGMAWRLDPGLVAWAYRTTKDVKLADTPKLAAARAPFRSEPASQGPPRVMIGASLGSVRFWHGEQRTRWARDWVKTWTDGQARLVMTAGEEQAILDVLTLVGKDGRVDPRRVLILRTASNYSREGDGQPQMIQFADGGSEAGFEAAWLVGSPVVKALVAGWDRYAAELPEMSLLERTFKLGERGTSVQTEVLAGATTFLTMAYIVLVNPAILGTTGMPVAGVAAATCLAAGIGCLLMGFLANYPIALAPGMGLNAYFAFTVVQGMGVPWQTALGLVFISGVAFFLLTLAGVRQLIVSAVPRALFSAIAAGIGLFIAFIGLKNAGLVVDNPATLVGLGSIHSPTVLLALLGLAILASLMVLKVRGAMFIGIVATAILGWILGLAEWKPQPYSLSEMTGTALQLDIPAALGIGGHGFGLALLEILFVFLFVDLFDNVGTLVAVSKRAGLMQPDGTIPRLNRILFADASATVVGSLAGTSTVVSYIESAAGVSAGGRTGLTAVVTGLLFLAVLFVAPWAGVIPAAATAPALILVGGMMLQPLTEIDWEDPIVAVPAFLTLVTIPLTFSIANGLAFGVIAYALLKAVTRRFERSDWLLYALAALFVARFAYMAFEA